MDLGLCPRCATPYTAADVAGLGILRARPEALGGPRVEYRCPGCRRVLVLVPHGEGRYAPIGEPPPGPVPPAERRPRWVGAAAAAAPASAPREAEIPGEPAAAADAAAAADPHAPLRADEALALLGLASLDGSDAVEQAFRARALACHPDKTAHLDPELQALAERKFKRLLEAYRLLQDACRRPD